MVIGVNIGGARINKIAASISLWLEEASLFELEQPTFEATRRKVRSDTLTEEKTYPDLTVIIGKTVIQIHSVGNPSTPSITACCPKNLAVRRQIFASIECLVLGSRFGRCAMTNGGEPESGDDITEEMHCE
jgi:hypothetical protein